MKRKRKSITNTKNDKEEEIISKQKEKEQEEPKRRRRGRPPKGSSSSAAAGVPRPSDVERRTCQHCETVMSSILGLKYHLDNKVCIRKGKAEAPQKKTKKELEVERTCKHCNHIYSTISTLQYHLDNKVCLKRKKGSEEEEEEEEEEVEEAQALQSEQNKKTENESLILERTCKHCNTEFTSTLGLKYHLDKKVCLRKAKAVEAQQVQQAQQFEQQKQQKTEEEKTEKEELMSASKQQEQQEQEQPKPKMKKKKGRPPTKKGSNSIVGGGGGGGPSELERTCKHCNIIMSSLYGLKYHLDNKVCLKGGANNKKKTNRGGKKVEEVEEAEEPDDEKEAQQQQQDNNISKSITTMSNDDNDDDDDDDDINNANNNKKAMMANKNNNNKKPSSKSTISSIPNIVASNRDLYSIMPSRAAKKNVSYTGMDTTKGHSSFKVVVDDSSTGDGATLVVYKKSKMNSKINNNKHHHHHQKKEEEKKKDDDNKVLVEEEEVEIAAATPSLPTMPAKKVTSTSTLATTTTKESIEESKVSSSSSDDAVAKERDDEVKNQQVLPMATTSTAVLSSPSSEEKKNPVSVITPEKTTTTKSTPTTRTRPSRFRAATAAAKHNSSSSSTSTDNKDSTTTTTPTTTTSSRGGRRKSKVTVLDDDEEEDTVIVNANNDDKEKTEDEEQTEEEKVGEKESTKVASVAEEEATTTAAKQNASTSSTSSTDNMDSTTATPLSSRGRRKSRILVETEDKKKKEEEEEENVPPGASVEAAETETAATTTTVESESSIKGNQTVTTTSDDGIMQTSTTTMSAKKKLPTPDPPVQEESPRARPSRVATQNVSYTGMDSTKGKSLLTPEEVNGDEKEVSSSRTTVKPKEPPNNFDEMFDKLVLYKQEHGNCLVPKEYKFDFKFGHWCCKQRTLKRKGMLSSDRIDQLNSINFDWDANPWNVMYNKLLQYKKQQQNDQNQNQQKKSENKKKKNLSSSRKKRDGSSSLVVEEESLSLSSWKDDPNMFKWVLNQRRKRLKLSSRRKKLLDNIGFQWSQRSTNILKDNGSDGEEHDDDEGVDQQIEGEDNEEEDNEEDDDDEGVINDAEEQGGGEEGETSMKKKAYSAIISKDRNRYQLRVFPGSKYVGSFGTLTAAERAKKAAEELMNIHGSTFDEAREAARATKTKEKEEGATVEEVDSKGNNKTTQQSGSSVVSQNKPTSSSTLLTEGSTNNNNRKGSTRSKSVAVHSKTKRNSKHQLQVYYYGSISTDRSRFQLRINPGNKYVGSFESRTKAERAKKIVEEGVNVLGSTFDEAREAARSLNTDNINDNNNNHGTAVIDDVYDGEDEDEDEDDDESILSNDTGGGSDDEKGGVKKSNDIPARGRIHTRHHKFQDKYELIMIIPWLKGKSTHPSKRNEFYIKLFKSRLQAEAAKQILENGLNIHGLTYEAAKEDAIVGSEAAVTVGKVDKKILRNGRSTGKEDDAGTCGFSDAEETFNNSKRVAKQPRGYIMKDGTRFQLRIMPGNRYIGSFPSQSLAERAQEVTLEYLNVRGSTFDAAKEAGRALMSTLVGGSSNNKSKKNSTKNSLPNGKERPTETNVTGCIFRCGTNFKLRISPGRRYIGSFPSKTLAERALEVTKYHMNSRGSTFEVAKEAGRVFMTQLPGNKVKHHSSTEKQLDSNKNHTDRKNAVTTTTKRHATKKVNGYIMKDGHGFQARINQRGSGGRYIGYFNSRSLAEHALEVTRDHLDSGSTFEVAKKAARALKEGTKEHLDPHHSSSFDVSKEEGRASMTAESNYSLDVPVRANRVKTFRGPTFSGSSSKRDQDNQEMKTREHPIRHEQKHTIENATGYIQKDGQGFQGRINPGGRYIGYFHSRSLAERACEIAKDHLDSGASFHEAKEAARALMGGRSNHSLDSKATYSQESIEEHLGSNHSSTFDERKEEDRTSRASHTSNNTAVKNSKTKSDDVASKRTASEFDTVQLLRQNLSAFVGIHSLMPPPPEGSIACRVMAVLAAKKKEAEDKMKTNHTLRGLML